MSRPRSEAPRFPFAPRVGEVRLDDSVLRRSEIPGSVDAFAMHVWRVRMRLGYPYGTRTMRWSAVFTGVVSCAMAVAGLPERASASEPRTPRTASLSWIRLNGADACVSTQDLARDVEAHLGRPVFVPPARADVSVEGHIAASGSGGWIAEFVLRDAEGQVLGTRELRDAAPSCSLMRESLALIVSVMIDPDAALDTPSAPRREPPATPPPAESSASPAPPRRDDWRLDAGVSFSSTAGLLPGLAIGARADAALEPPRFVPLRVYANVWLDQEASATEGAGRAVMSSKYLGVGLCPVHPRRTRVAFFACASAQLGFTTVRPRGFDETEPDEDRLHVAGALEAFASFRLVGPIAARAGVTGALPMLRDSFTYGRADGVTRVELFRMSPVTFALDLGIGIVL